MSVVMKPLNAVQRRMLERAAAQYCEDYDSPDDQAHEYLEDTRGLSFATIGRLRFGVVRHPITQAHKRFTGMIAIPNIGLAPDQHVVGIDFRAIDPTAKKHDRPEGQPVRLYNLRALSYADDTVWMTEGCINAASLEDVGLPAVGIPGAQQWGKAHAYRNRIVEGYRVVLMQDADEAGAALAKAMSDIDNLIVRNCLPYNDCNEMLTKAGPQALLHRANGTDDEEAS